MFTYLIRVLAYHWPSVAYRTKMDFVSKVKQSILVVYENISAMSLHRFVIWFIYI
jgi:hypothetical protein